MQKGLITQVLETLDLDVRTANEKFTPAQEKSLAQHLNGEPAYGGFNYSSVVGMLLYLARHIYPDNTYDVNYAARYMFCPILVQEYTPKHIILYLKANSDMRLVMKPLEKLLKICSFPDADFSGMKRHMDDPV